MGVDVLLMTHLVCLLYVGVDVLLQTERERRLDRDV